LSGGARRAGGRAKEGDVSDNQSRSESSGSWTKLALLGAVSAYLIYDMATATETPSLALNVLQYFILGCCLVGFAGLLVQLTSAKRQP
jgi:hypothetical protein